MEEVDSRRLRERLLCSEGSSSGRDESLRHFGGSPNAGEARLHISVFALKTTAVAAAEAQPDAQGS